MAGESTWWTSLLSQPVMSIQDVHSMPEYSMITVSGILAMMVMEEKVVKSETKFLLTDVESAPTAAAA